MLIMTHSPLVNAIVDVIFNENEIRSVPYTPATPDVEDRKVCAVYPFKRKHIVKCFLIRYCLKVKANHLLYITQI